MKTVLLVSNNPLSDTQHNAKTVLSLLGNTDLFSLRQIYFRDDSPTFQFCDYYKITDRQVLKSVFFPSKKAGQPIVATDFFNNAPISITPPVPTNSYMKRLLREIVWKLGHINYLQLTNWLKMTPIDALFFVGGDSVFAYDFVYFLCNYLKCPLILFITDDYLLKRSNSSIWFELRRRMLLRSVKRIINDVDLFITISNKMSDVYSHLLNKNSFFYANMPDSPILENAGSLQNKKIIITYAGGLHYNRWKPLSVLAKAIDHYNRENGYRVELHIYSQNQPKGEIADELLIPNACVYKGFLSGECIKDVLYSSDILVHAESFDPKDIEATCLSFSTKIYEYMGTGKPILAIGPSSVASMEYLKDCSFYCSSLDSISIELIERLINSDERVEVSQRSIKKYQDLSKSENGRQEIIKKIIGVCK